MAAGSMLGSDAIGSTAGAGEAVAAGAGDSERPQAAVMASVAAVIARKRRRFGIPSLYDADLRGSGPPGLFVGNRPLGFADTKPAVAVGLELDHVQAARVRLAAILRE